MAKADSTDKPGRLAIQIALVFVAALALYLAAYSGIEHRRVRKGPWEVTFTNDASGAPMISIFQPRLGLTNVQIVFPGATQSGSNAATTLAFAQPRPVPFDVPFGKCIFMDTTFLPGTIVFDMFGHEVQLIPRVLTIDKQERPWQSGAVITL